MSVAIYCRVSTDEQRERQTIENQIDIATRHCKSNDMLIHDFYLDDGVTGTIPLADRPQGKRLVDDAREQKFDTVIVKQVDRLGRDALHILNAVAQLESLNVKVISIIEAMDLTTPQGRFMLTMYSGVAALECRDATRPSCGPLELHSGLLSVQSAARDSHAEEWRSGTVAGGDPDADAILYWWVD
jgi:DNA invertase Pin-like site-specific DNA recombinase